MGDAGGKAETTFLTRLLVQTKKVVVHADIAHLANALEPGFNAREILGTLHCANQFGNITLGFFIH